jgi:preprotein translocase subunit SecA
MGVGGPGTSEAELDELPTRDDIVGHLHELVDEALETREREHGEEVWSQVERFVLLRTIDSLWVEHLTELDDMRRGIGLRGYAQQDPLNEFRKEAFRLYEELSDLIRRQVATTIFRVTVTREPATVPLSGPGQPARVDGATARPAAVGAGAASATAVAGAAAGVPSPFRGATATSAGAGPMTGLPSDPMRGAREAPGNGAGTDGVRQGFTPSGERIGRNDPCWCGSGQKYKKCHGA